MNIAPPLLPPPPTSTFYLILSYLILSYLILSYRIMPTRVMEWQAAPLEELIESSDFSAWMTHLQGRIGLDKNSDIHDLYTRTGVTDLVVPLIS